VFFTPRSGAPKRSDGGLVLEILDISPLTQIPKSEPQISVSGIKSAEQDYCVKIGPFRGAKAD
jgi:hypothetical protein